MAHAKVSKDIEMDDDDCDNENPFAELFNRMKTSTAPKAAKAKSAAAPKAAAGAPKSKAANRNKKAESDRGSFAPPVKTPGKGDMTQDDEEASSKFRTLVDDFYMLDAASADDDASFASWAKAKIQNMQDLKNQITNKKKSLKRRSTNKDSELGPILDKYAAELTALMDFVRKLSNGNSEGLQLYNTVVDSQQLQVCRTIWKRVLRAAAMDSLKLCKWDYCFNELHTMCLTTCGDDAASFYPLLLSQLLQRLLKAVQIPTNKPLPSDSLTYVRQFVGAALVDAHVAKSLQPGWSAGDHLKVLVATRDVLDCSASPTAIGCAVDMLISETAKHHWAASAFSLSQGKKIMEAAAANAKAREALSGVLDVLHKSEERLRASGLCNLEAPFLASLSKCFNEEHGVMVSEVLVDLSQKGMKVLKGADREKLLRVQEMVRSACGFIVMACVKHELLPWLKTWMANLAAKQPTNVPMLAPTSCVMRLADGCGHGQESLVAMIKDASTFLGELQKKIAGPALPASEVSSLTTTWNVKSKALVASFSASAAKCGANENVTILVEELKVTVGKASSAIEEALKAEVQGEAWASVKKCMSLFERLVSAWVCDENVCDIPRWKSEFEQEVESAKLYSTVLSDSRTTVCDGLEHALLLAQAIVAQEQPSVVALKDGAEPKLNTALIKVTRQLGAYTNPASMILLLSELKIWPEDFLEGLMATQEDVMNSAKTELEAFATACRRELSLCIINPSMIDIPDSILKVQAYSEIDAAVVKDKFDIERLKEVSELAVKLQTTIDFVAQTADTCGIPPNEIAELPKYQESYRSAIKWMTTGNVLFSLLTKAISRAVLTSSKPTGKALASLQESLKYASENEVEIPPGLQALVSKVIQGEEVQASA